MLDFNCELFDHKIDSRLCPWLSTYFMVLLINLTNFSDHLLFFHFFHKLIMKRFSSQDISQNNSSTTVAIVLCVPLRKNSEKDELCSQLNSPGPKTMGKKSEAKFTDSLNQWMLMISTGISIHLEDFTNQLLNIFKKKFCPREHKELFSLIPPPS